MKSRLRWLGIALAVVAGLIVYARWANEAMTSPPERSGELARLPACPDSPNCVCTLDTSEEHAIEPIRFSEAEEPEDVLKKVEEVVRAMGGRVTDSSREHYRRAEFTTPILRFVDDVEFLVAEDGKTLHFRSASRVGHSDLGVNRKRMERFRKLYEAL